MSRFLPFCLCVVLFTASQVGARTEYRLGGVDGTPWLDALNQNEAGAYLIFDADGQQVGSVPIATAPQGSGADTLIDFSGTSIQSLFIDPMVNLTEFGTVVGRYLQVEVVLMAGSDKSAPTLKNIDVVASIYDQ